MCGYKRPRNSLFFFNWDSMVLDWDSWFFTRWVPGLAITICNKITAMYCYTIFKLNWEILTLKGLAIQKVDNTIHQINLITIQQMGHLLSLRFILWIVTFSLTWVSCETHNLLAVFLRIQDSKGWLGPQAFLAETMETGNKNHCVTKAMHVLRRKLSKD